jgi:hypothetical protein
MMSIEDQDKVTTATQTGIEEADQVIFITDKDGTNSFDFLTDKDGTNSCDFLDAKVLTIVSFSKTLRLTHSFCR